MKFSVLDQKMRAFETTNDRCVLPEVYMVARIDGRSFTRLTKEICKFEAPYGAKFRDAMLETTRSIMQCGIGVSYAYTQSDEISLLIERDETAFSRKLRKMNSVLAGEASATFSLAVGEPAAFDCRISELPNKTLVVDYFRWRAEDASRNALSSYCYWSLRKSGMNARSASKLLLNKTVADKNELLFREFGINYNEIPTWQKRGVGLYWENYEKQSVDPRTILQTTATRRRIRTDFELPMNNEYSEYIRRLIS